MTYDSLDDLFDAARLRRIEDVFASLELKRSGPHELRGACPNCGGTKRLVIDVRKQVFFCRDCAPDGSRGAGNVINVAMFLHGFDSVAAAPVARR
jgi:hypothetical protein